MSDNARSYIIRRCPECHGQVGEKAIVHFTDCPNIYRTFVADEVEVTWPTDTREAERRRNEAMEAIHAYYATWGSIDGRPTVAQARRIVQVLDEAGMLRVPVRDKWDQDDSD